MTLDCVMSMLWYHNPFALTLPLCSLWFLIIKKGGKKLWLWLFGWPHFLCPAIFFLMIANGWILNMILLWVPQSWHTMCSCVCSSVWLGNRQFSHRISHLYIFLSGLRHPVRDFSQLYNWLWSQRFLIKMKVDASFLVGKNCGLYLNGGPLNKLEHFFVMPQKPKILSWLLQFLDLGWSPKISCDPFEKCHS